MKELNISTTYFLQCGEVNTERTVELAARRTRELGFQKVLVASTSGATGLLVAQRLNDMDVIVISHSTGFQGADSQEMPDETRSKITASSAKILTATHLFGGVNRAIRLKFNTIEVDEIIANTLRLFGQGTKVAVEIAIMAADAGFVRTDEPLISIAGTNKGADTAIVIQPVHAQAFFDIKILEFICMPSPFHPGGR